MSAALSAVPAARRRRAAAVAGLLAALLVAVGVLPWVAPAPVVVRVLATLALLLGAFCALVAWGLARSLRLQRHEAALDAAVAEAVVASGRQTCDCGHEHDPEEMRVMPACERAQECDHSCESCVLSRG